MTTAPSPGRSAAPSLDRSSAPEGLRLTVVGCAGSYPGPASAASCYLLEAPGGGTAPDAVTRVVLDLGSGALGPLQHHLDPRALDAVLLSHLHADHCLDLTGLYVLQRHHPDGPTGRRVPVWGPTGTGARLARAYDLQDPDAMSGELDVREWTPGRPVTVGSLRLTPFAVRHPVEAYALRVAWTGPDHRERVLAYSGDTDTCDGLDDAARGADLLLCEAAFVEGRDEARGIHLTGRRAGEVAARAGVASLLLTHVPAWNDPGAARAEAAEVYDGPLATARPGAVHVVGPARQTYGRPWDGGRARPGAPAGWMAGVTSPTQTSPARHDGRAPDDLREVRITRAWTEQPEGSVLVEFGRTRVMCTASFTPGVPRWRKGSGQGWVTAEYAMLPRSTNTRSDRESTKGKVGGRTHEISRLVGRALRAVVDTSALGENTIQLDCDVLQADGGTRTAAITGAYVALADAISWAKEKGHVKKNARALTGSVAAVSVGVVDGRAVLDLDYPEDVSAGTDMNVVCTGDGRFVEVQGTAEGAPFDRSELDGLLDLAVLGCGLLTEVQQQALDR